jgi:hypothetical protein
MTVEAGSAPSALPFPAATAPAQAFLSDLPDDVGDHGRPSPTLERIAMQPAGVAPVVGKL